MTNLIGGANLIDNEIHVTAETISVGCLWHTRVKDWYIVVANCKAIIDFSIDLRLLQPMEAHHVANRSLPYHTASLFKDVSRLVTYSSKP